MRRADNAGLARITGEEQAQIEHIVAQAQGVNPERPMVVNIHLPSAPTGAEVQPETSRAIDWTAVILFGLPALIVIIIASYIFVGCMSQAPPPPAPIVPKYLPHCVVFC